MPGGNPQRLRRARRQPQRAERGDNARPIPMTSAAQATGAGNKHQAHPPQAPPTRCTAHTRNLRSNGTRAITPAPPTLPGPKGGGQQGSERHGDNWWTRNQTTPHQNVPTTAPAPQNEPQAPRHASVPQAWTARSIPPKTQTTVMCRGATPTTTTAPAIVAEGGHQTHTPKSSHTRCTAHSEKNPNTPTQRPKGTLTTAQGRPTQPGPTGKREPEGRVQSNGWTRNRTTPHHHAPTTAA